MALQHAREGEPINLQAYGAALGMQRTHALFKSEQLEVIRIVLMAGKQFSGHRPVGDITIQCLEGRVEYRTAQQACILAAGAMLYVAAGTPHILSALEDASLLMTMRLP